MSLPELLEVTALPKSRRLLVGVSGGADSVALLHLLVAHGFRNLVVCHLNHRLRGAESDADERFVRRLARSLAIPCECGRQDVAARARRDKVSTEVAARAARHEFFAACAAGFRCPRVVLAHHADDQAETVLLNLVRGASDLTGMKAASVQRVGGRRLELLRPLLEWRRSDLRAWLAQRGHMFREDSSNAVPWTPRNRLRHELMPLLAEVAGRDPVPAITRAAAIAAGIRSALAQVLPVLHVEDPQGRLHLATLRALPAALQSAVLHDWLRRQGVPDLSSRLLDAARGIADPAAQPALNLPGGARLRRRGGRLFIDKPA